ncbi:hypothetical protein FQZ97_533720 [compost metagenome]
MLEAGQQEGFKRRGWVLEPNLGQCSQCGEEDQCEGQGSENTKGAALVIPLLPPRARERGAVKLPHTPQPRLFGQVRGQGCAAPVLPFAGTVELFRRAGSAAPDRIRPPSAGESWSEPANGRRWRVVMDCTSDQKISLG